MNIIGLGSAGVKIADCFGKYPQYDIYKIDVGLEGERCYALPECDSAEEYETVKLPRIKTFFKGLKGEALVIIGGSGKVSCASLRILENIRSLSISIMYIKPDMSLLGGTPLLREKVVFGVLQEYARSGVFEKMYLISNEALDEIIDGAPIIGYHDKLNEVLVPAFHMIKVFDNTDPVIGKIEKSKITHRITTIGIYDAAKNKEKKFFSLDNVREKCYIYGINEEKLKNDGKLFKKIMSQIKSKSEENVKVSYAIYSTDYDYDIAYVIERTPCIQNKNNE